MLYNPKRHCWTAGKEFSNDNGVLHGPWRQVGGYGRSHTTQPGKPWCFRVARPGLWQSRDERHLHRQSWRWDIVMYLRSMDIRFYKAPSGGLIASGHWKNSVLHQFPNADGVVQDLIDEMFKQAGEPNAVRTEAASNKPLLGNE
jgi:hypothetical protein